MKGRNGAGLAGPVPETLSVAGKSLILGRGERWIWPSGVVHDFPKATEERVRKKGQATRRWGTAMAVKKNWRNGRPDSWHFLECAVIFLRVPFHLFMSQ